MLKRLIIFIPILMLFFISGYSTCEISNLETSCKSISNSFNEFNLTFNENIDLKSYKSKIYLKDTSNYIRTSQNKNIVKNLEPFTDSGIYVLEIEVENKAGTKESKKFEFIFDNSNPIPPIIPTGLETNNDQIIFSIEINNNNELIIQDKNRINKEYQILNKTGSNMKISLDIDSKNTYLRFIGKDKSTGLLSMPVERIIKTQNYWIPSSQKTTNIIFSNLTNYNTISDYGIFTKQVEDKYLTNKALFYIEGILVGPNKKGVEVSINGDKTYTNEENKFSTFVNLEENSLNKISIITEDFYEQELFVNYTDINFHFLNDPMFGSKSIVENKVINNEIQTITGNVSIAYPFNVYINGEFNQIVYPNSLNNQYLFKLEDLNPGKNTLFFQGFNGQEKYYTFYVDTQIPIAKLISFTNMTKSEELIFEINDDLGIDKSSLKLLINSNEYELLKSENNFYYYNISELNLGTYAYELSGKDLANKLFSTKDSILINEKVTILDEIKWDSYNDLKIIGNKIFTKSREGRIKIQPSKNIAFEKILMDKKDITSYNINFDNSIDLDLNFEKSTGELVFRYIDQDYNKYEQKYLYYTDLEDPVIELDYLRNPSVSLERNSIVLTGNIKDSYFDKNSLSILGVENEQILWFGDNFEAIYSYENLETGFNNKDIFGVDLSGNELNIFEGNYIFKDITTTQIILDSQEENVENLISGKLSNSNTNILNKVYELFGLNTFSFYLGNSNFKLPSIDVQGLNPIKIKGIEQSGKYFNFLGYQIVDNRIPQIYFFENGKDNLEIIIDGTNSKIKDYSISLNSNSSLELSECDYEFSNKECFNLEIDRNSDNIIFVEAKDLFGNYKNETYIFNKIQNPENEEIVLNFENINSPLITSEFYNYNPILGTIDIKYRINYDIISNNSKIKSEIKFICNPNKDYGQYCGNEEKDNSELLNKTNLVNQILITQSGKSNLFVKNIIDEQANYRFNEFEIEIEIDSQIITKKLPITPINVLSSDIGCFYIDNSFKCSKLYDPVIYNIKSQYNFNKENIIVELTGNIHEDLILQNVSTDLDVYSCSILENAKNNFICSFEINSGETPVTIFVVDVNGKTAQVTTRVYSDPALKVQIFGIDLFDPKRSYFINGQYVGDNNIIKILGNSNKKNIISLDVNGQKRIIGEKEGNFSYNLNLSSYINSDVEEFRIELSGIDSNRNNLEKKSSPIRYIYNEILEVIALILVE